MKSAFAAAISTLILSGSALAAAVPFSDSFEAPLVTSSLTYEVFQDDVGDNGDWNTIAGSGIEIQTAPTLGFTPFDGDQYVELDSFDNSTMAALIDFVAGQSYEISFYYRPRTNTPNDNIIALSVGVYDETAGTFGGAAQLILANDVTSSPTGGD